MCLSMKGASAALCNRPAHTCPTSILALYTACVLMYSLLPVMSADRFGASATCCSSGMPDG